MIHYNFQQKIKIFIGYQFESEFYDKDNFVKSVQDYCQTVKEELTSKFDSLKGRLEIESRDFHLKTGETINNLIHTQIRESDICIFEVSDNNPNVMYEAGYAIGLGKIIIYVSQISRLRLVASDISGIGLAAYEKKSLEDLEINLKTEIEKAVIQFIKSKSVVDSFWEFSQESTTAFLGKNRANFSIGDLKALELIRAKIKYHQNIEIGFARKFQDRLIENLIIIGGPKSNQYVDRVFSITEQDIYKIVKKDDIISKNKYCIVDNKNNVLYETDYILGESNGITLKDYAIVHLGRNIYHKKKKWFVFSGLSRIGTLESIKCFLDEKKLADILEQISYDPKKDYVMVFEFGVFDDASFGYDLLEFQTVTNK